MKKSLLIIALILTVSFPVAAMTDSPEDDIVIPGENFEVEITDIDGVVTRGVNVSFEKHTYITAKRGSTTIFIPFEKIKEITLKNNHEVITRELPEISLMILLKDGSEYESQGSSREEMTGQAGFGKFKIRLDHIQKIVFINHITPEKSNN